MKTNININKMKNKKTGKTVYFKDGTHIYVADGITWEYENDANWLKTL